MDFARFPSSYSPQPGGATPIGTFAGLTGGIPVLANVMTDPFSPFDPVRSGGESFDLADLSNDPLVVMGLVDLQQITQVRIVDVPDGPGTDSNGTPIDVFGSADIDAICALHHDQEAADGPICELSIDDSGFMHLVLGDPNGFDDLDLQSLSVSFSLSVQPTSVLRRLFEITAKSPNQIEFVSVFSVNGLVNPSTLAISVRDQAGSICGDQIFLQ